MPQRSSFRSVARAKTATPSNGAFDNTLTCVAIAAAATGVVLPGALALAGMALPPAGWMFTMSVGALAGYAYGAGRKNG